MSASEQAMKTFLSRLSGPLPTSYAGKNAANSNPTILNIADPTKYVQGLGLKLTRAKTIIQNPTHTALGGNNVTSIFLYKGGGSAPAAAQIGYEILPGQTFYEDVVPSSNPHYIRLAAALGAGDSLNVYMEDA